MRAWPSVVALAPRITKIVANPKTKHALRASARTRTISSLDVVDSGIDWPAIYDTYPGTSGRTQGDRNEMIPAANTAVIEAIEGPIVHRYRDASFRFIADVLSRHGSYPVTFRGLWHRAGSDRPSQSPACH